MKFLNIELATKKAGLIDIGCEEARLAGIPNNSFACCNLDFMINSGRCDLLVGFAASKYLGI